MCVWMVCVCVPFLLYANVFFFFFPCSGVNGVERE